MGERVSRVDIGARIRADHRTPQGGARIPANLTRTGVLLYPQADGSTRREYRPPSEVFDARSMKTLETATVTIGHPGMVDPSQWKQHAVGNVIGPRREGRFLASDLVVQDAAALARVNLPASDANALSELSCGYDCELELTAGTSPDGEKYDAVQRNITYNHVALLPVGSARAGSEVRLRLDGISSAVEDDADLRRRPAPMSGEQVEQNKATKDLEARLDALTNDFAKERARTDGLQKQIDTVTAQRDELKAKLDAAEKKADASVIDTAVRERIVVLDGARLLHGKDVDNKGTDVEIMVAAIKARDDKFDATGRSADYIRARFDAKVEDAKKAHGGLANVNRASGGGENRSDAAERLDEEADPIGAVQRHNDAWQADAWARPNSQTIHRGNAAGAVR